MRRFAFVSGLILGGGLVAWLLGSAFCYLFTGKLPAFQIGPDRRPRLDLIDIGGLYEVPAVVPVANRGPTRGWSPESEAA